MSEQNGIHKDCPLSESWNEIKGSYQKMLLEVHDTHRIMHELMTHTKHLSKLDALEDIRDSLLDSATGKSHIDIKTAGMLFKILGAVIFALLLVIVFLLTGEKLGILNLLHHG